MLRISHKTASKVALISIGFSMCIVYGSYLAGFIEADRSSRPFTALLNHQAKSEYQLAMDYLTGHGVQVNKKKALELITQSAEQGYGEAQFLLGNAYYQGLADQNINQNYSKAYVWYSLAALAGYAKASVLRYEVSANLSPAELMAAKKEIANFQNNHI